MPDTLDAMGRSERMSRIKAKNTKPELTVRKLVHGMGFRYRLHKKDLPGSPDLAFSSRKKAIFVHGCFWHRHADSACALARLPKSRREFWGPKLEGNALRDKANEEKLGQLGWISLVVWECELRDQLSVASKIKKFLCDEVD
ncbi:very short patch repair endonuclease [Rhizobium leguminosarum]|uniref:very short patch repair endonuclease n=1 Tax=Rhizobium leguminosarum TaxID=384 RepID=UPI001C900C8D|nr:DNA mismatch endonuclease Vsr [Rhizobium leguminosarum]MBY2937193.1 DNA mismatch endonuclease Vsr [Rhizobium leguminosarum]